MQVFQQSKKNAKLIHCFCFFFSVILADIHEKVRSMDTAKVSRNNDIRAKIIKRNPDICSFFSFRFFISQFLSYQILCLFLKKD